MDGVGAVHALGPDGRVDLYVYNEATAWTLSSRRLILEAPLSDDEPWEAAVADGRMMAMQLYQDDSFHVRVVLGELADEEAESWIGRASWWLRIPDGELVVAAGGEFVWGYTLEYEEYSEFVHRVTVPAGDYRVDVYTTLTGVNGLWALNRTGSDEALGAWWRRTRPNEEMPPWLQFLLLEHLAEDPGHEGEWDGWSTARHHAVMDAVERGAWIDWIVQLRPLEGSPPTELPEMDEGCCTEPELRIPERCPRGLSGEPVNADSPEEQEPLQPVDVLERLTATVVQEIEGGAVTIPLSDVELPARLAWFAHRDVDGEVLVDGGELGYWAEQYLPADDVFLRTAPDGRFRIGFPETVGVYDLLHRLGRIGPALGELPEGAELELVTAGPDPGPEGQLRLWGSVRGGMWLVERAYPRVDADTLEAALALARSADGDRVETRDDEELEAVRVRWRADGMQRIAKLRVEGLSIGHGEGARFTYVIAAAVFAVRFGDVWPCPEPDDPLADIDLGDEAAQGEELFAMVAGLEFSFESPLLDAESGRAYIDVATEDVPGEVRRATDPLLDEFEAVGSVRVGDLVCSLNPSVLIRGVAEKHARYYGTLLIAPFVGVVAEAYSRFQDGSSLTTTTNAFPGGGAPEAKIHWNPIAHGTTPSGVVEAHLAAVEEYVVKHDTTVTPVRQNLLALAEAIEEFLVRRTGA